MSVKLKVALIVIGVIVLFVIGQIIWSALNQRPDEGGETGQPTSGSEDGQLPTTTGEVTKSPTSKPASDQVVPGVPEENLTEKEIVGLALPFAAVFGSYSNQSDFENFRDLRYFMTDKMKNWVDEYISQHRSVDKPVAYFGVTTKALKSEVESVNADGAVVTVYTQRKESTGVKSNYRVYYQNLELVFKQVGGAWKVDGAYWK